MSLAALYDLPLVGVSSVGKLTEGPWAGRKCIGCSLAVGRTGRILLQASYGRAARELAIVELELSPPPAAGTGYAPLLRKQGYEGP